MEKTVKTDLFKIDPHAIVIEEGFNSRVNFDLDSLVESIKENGVLNPVTCIRLKVEGGEERYQLVDGERRYRATMKAIEEGADITRIPCIIIPKISKEERLVQQIVRNEGKPFNEYEYGIACHKLEQLGKTRQEIAKMLGKCVGQIQYFCEHLDRDERIQELLRDNKISGSEVRRIYHCYRNENGTINEAGAVKEILNAMENAKSKGKSKITSKDLEGRTQTVKRNEMVLKALREIKALFAKYSDGGKIRLGLTPFTILEELEKKRDLEEIFSEYAKQAKLKDAV